jgi:hypothetical protein
VQTSKSCGVLLFEIIKYILVIFVKNVLVLRYIGLTWLLFIIHRDTQIKYDLVYAAKIFGRHYRLEAFSFVILYETVLVFRCQLEEVNVNENKLGGQSGS